MYRYTHGIKMFKSYRINKILMKPGIYLRKGIYYSIEFDYDLSVFRSYFVYNSLSGTRDLLQLSQAKEAAERYEGLNVTINATGVQPVMLYWEFNGREKNNNYLKKVTEECIDSIRSWEYTSKAKLAENR